MTTIPTAARTMPRWLLPVLLGLLGLLTILALILMLPRGEADAETMAAADALVRAGRPAEAVLLYEGLVAAGAHDSALYYNLGSARFLAGDAAGAVAAFRQALALAPGDEDIQTNLAVAEALAPEMALPPPAAPFGPLAALTSWMTIDALAVIVLLMWLVVIGLWLAWRMTGNRWPRRLLLAAGLLLLVAGLSFAARLALSGPDVIQGALLRLVL
jgi:tetratricopeptide (TPR) repeat protein